MNEITSQSKQDQLKQSVLLLSLVQVVHGEEPDPVHPLGGRVQQQLLLQSKPGTQRRTQPELSPRLPERPGAEPAGRETLLHRVVPICGRRLHLRLGPNQHELNHQNLIRTQIWTWPPGPTAGNKRDYILIKKSTL